MALLSHRSATAVTSVIALLALSLASCEGRESSPTSLPEKADAPSTESIFAVVEHAPEETRVYGQPDQYFVELAERHPGFAGIYFDESDELVIATTSGVIPPGLTDIGHPSVPKRAAVADFSFTTLARWYGAFVDAVATTEWYTTDIDERRNRLVATVADIDQTRAALSAVGVPRAIYVLEEGNQPEPVSTIHSEFRPVPGALEIAGCDPDGGGCFSSCTLGFNLNHWNYGETFLTASHCTLSIGQVGGTSIAQPDPGQRIGFEIYDEAVFSNSECPNTFCRYSDAALIQYEPDVDYEFGKIVKTEEVEGSITEDFPGSRYVIVDEAIGGITDGTPVLQIGKTDGWSDGDVNATCANVQSGTRSDLTFLCQYKSKSGTKGGDSGGPVFIPSASEDSVILAGIIIKEHVDISFDSDAWFSPIEGIRMELNGDPNLTCDGLLTTVEGGCGTGGGGGSGGTGDDDCGPYAIQEC